MPDLNTPLHLDMLRIARKRPTLTVRVKRAIKVLLGKEDFYGLEWGDPDKIAPLRHVKDHFLLPYFDRGSNII